ARLSKSDYRDRPPSVTPSAFRRGLGYSRRTSTPLVRPVPGFCTKGGMPFLIAWSVSINSGALITCTHHTIEVEMNRNERNLNAKLVSRKPDHWLFSFFCSCRYATATFND